MLIIVLHLHRPAAVRLVSGTPHGLGGTMFFHMSLIIEPAAIWCEGWMRLYAGAGVVHKYRFAPSFVSLLYFVSSLFLELVTHSFTHQK